MGIGSKFNDENQKDILKCYNNWIIKSHKKKKRKKKLNIKKEKLSKLGKKKLSHNIIIWMPSYKINGNGRFWKK